MDIAFLKTFLEVSRRRHFGKAAETLCLTQSAVSARIKLLENTLGVELFIRNRNDIQLTPAGQRLQKHARTIVDGWEQARQGVALNEEFNRSLIVGALGDIWSMYLLDWTIQIREAQPDIALHLESFSAETLLQRLESGLIDLALLFDPPQSVDFVIREAASIELILVDTMAERSIAEVLQQGFIMVDWGTSFALSFAAQLPDTGVPATRTNQGRIALELLEKQAGSAYLPTVLVEKKLAEGTLHRVADAPIMERVIYALYRPGGQQEETIRAALTSLKSS